jgi:hypothetical protein
VLGMEQAIEKHKELSDEAMSILDTVELKTASLKLLTEEIIKRSK